MHQVLTRWDQPQIQALLTSGRFLSQEFVRRQGVGRPWCSSSRRAILRWAQREPRKILGNSSNIRFGNKWVFVWRSRYRPWVGLLLGSLSQGTAKKVLDNKTYTIVGTTQYLAPDSWQPWPLTTAVAFITILRMSWNWYRNILLLVYLDMISWRFFSQEVHNGEGFTTAADGWAFGILVFELITGQCLFESLEEIRKGSLAECPMLRRNSERQQKFVEIIVFANRVKFPKSSSSKAKSYRQNWCKFVAM